MLEKRGKNEKIVYTIILIVALGASALPAILMIIADHLK